MSEATLRFFIYLVNSIAGSLYVQKLLQKKYKKEITLLAWAGSYFVIQSLVFGNINENGFIGVLADIAILLLLQAVLYQSDFSAKLFTAVSFTAGKDIIKYIITGVSSSLYWFIREGGFLEVAAKKITTAEEVNTWSLRISSGINLIVLLLYAILLTVYLSILGKKFVKRDYQLRVHEYAFLILPSAATLCISVTIRMLILYVENGFTMTIFERVPATMFWVPLICFLLLGTIVSSAILFQKMVQLNEEERERVILETQMAQMQQEIEEIQDIYADIRGLGHDMRSHLESIAAVIRKTSGEDREELDGYIGSMERAVGRLDFSYRTGNPITDVIIHQKKQDAEKRHISFEASFTYPDKQQIDVYDIGIMLNNALENAIEASGKLEGEKNISLRSYMKGNLFFIEVENDFAGELVMDSKTGLPISSKADKRLHGLGIENIQRCAKKYMGDIDITIRDLGARKRFCLTIMVYEKYFTPKKSYFAP